MLALARDRTMMRTLRTESGQSTLEAAVVSGALVFFVTLLSALLYFCFLQSYLKYSSHEYLVCREISDPWLCEKQFKKATTSLVRFGKIESLWVQEEPLRRTLRLRIQWQVLQKNVRWDYQDRILLPLQGD